MEANQAPNELTSDQRSAAIMNVRRRVVAGEPVTDDEIRNTISLIRANRSIAGEAKTKKKSTSPAVAAASLDEF